MERSTGVAYLSWNDWFTVLLGLFEMYLVADVSPRNKAVSLHYPL